MAFRWILDSILGCMPCQCREKERTPSMIYLPTEIEPNLISGGCTAKIVRTPSGNARKTTYSHALEPECDRDDIRHEYEIYKHLGSHPRLLRCIRYSPDDGLTLELMENGNLREFLRSHQDEISDSQRRQWVADAIEAVILLHSFNVVHGDIKPENMLLDDSMRLRIIDFSGSAAFGRAASALESYRFYLPRSFDDPSTKRTDLFALGSTIYEIVTGEQPYEQLEDDGVQALFSRNIFPDTTGLLCAAIIDKCWKSDIQAAQDLLGLVEPVSVGSPVPPLCVTVHSSGIS